MKLCNTNELVIRHYDTKMSWLIGGGGSIVSTTMLCAGIGGVVNHTLLGGMGIILGMIGVIASIIIAIESWSSFSSTKEIVAPYSPVIKIIKNKESDNFRLYYKRFGKYRLWEGHRFTTPEDALHEYKLAYANRHLSITEDIGEIAYEGNINRPSVKLLDSKSN